MKNTTQYKASELVGKTFYVTSQYSKNVPFHITGTNFNGKDVLVDTFEGKMNGRPHRKVIAASYTIESINDMIAKNIISATKIK